ncbi:NAD(P)-binding domain-containing protein [Aeromicrobium sp. UC242_57]|uniref:NAD(P)-binding domain-containing protein n=1 Tax=Aeromicrobium sp. UC242_57 TaxID=3374624 RepID=UPI0037B842F8
MLVIGAGGGGLSVGACLETMGIDTLLIEKNERVGDNWRNRYDALVLHSARHGRRLPFLSYPSNWPLYPTKEKYGDWLESFQKASDINVWTSSEVVDAKFDPNAKRWTVTINTPEGQRVLHPEELIVATGFSGKAKLPDVPGSDVYSGTILHSQEYKSADGFEGKKAVVVGAGTSAHDIAEDLYHRGVDVTMIQRSGSYIMSREGGNSVLYGEFHEDALPKEWLDLQVMSFPWPLAMQMAPAQTAQIAEIDKELLDGLRGVGFQPIAGDPVVGPNSGLLSLGIREGGPGNYYIDAGSFATAHRRQDQAAFWRGTDRLHRERDRPERWVGARGRPGRVRHRLRVAARGLAGLPGRGGRQPAAAARRSGPSQRKEPSVPAVGLPASSVHRRRPLRGAAVLQVRCHASRG